ncbi:hypothetical protein [Saccharococcus sp. Marseille-Q5394]|uniref:hypothetical protein n=1 Tax=Saccharococcus sp. Marseille-Q5394 TaxID=2972778 RepID=UPI0021C577D9|nr:hypothetical protein [Saccharococcus sp. Marseille-Q5394]
MDFLLWITVGFIVIGFVVLVFMKKSMERKLSLIIENEESLESEQTSTKPIVWWIWGAVLWGIVSIFLTVWSFSVYT